MTIYLDIILIENVLMNYIILFTTGLSIKLKVKNKRLIFSSLIGASYAIAQYIIKAPVYSSIIGKLLLSVTMVFIGFNPKSIKEISKELLIFYLSSFIMGGCALAMLYLISPQDVKIINGCLVGTYPLKILLIAGTIGFIIIQISFRINKRELKHKDLLCNLEICINGKNINTKGLIDSGNTLKEPISKKSVIIVEKEVISQIIDTNNLLGGDTKEKLKIIPFKSIGKQNGILMGLKTDYCIVKNNEEFIKKENVIIGLYEKKIGNNYSALIGMDFFEKGEDNEYHKYSKKSIL